MNESDTKPTSPTYNPPHRSSPLVLEMKKRLKELLFLLKNRDERQDQSYETYKNLMEEYDLLFEKYSQTLGLESGGK